MSLLYWLRRYGAYPVLVPLHEEGDYPSAWLNRLPTPGGQVWVLSKEGSRVLRVPPLRLTGEGLAWRATLALVHRLAREHGLEAVPIRGSKALSLGGLVVLFSTRKDEVHLEMNFPHIVFSPRRPRGRVLAWVPLEPGGYQHLAQVLDAHLQGR